MGIVFRDYLPVECDCGCTVFSGFVNEATITVMHRGKPKTIIYTYCDEDHHDALAMHDALWRYQSVEIYDVTTKDDKEKIYADTRRDD